MAEYRLFFLMSDPDRYVGATFGGSTKPRRYKLAICFCDGRRVSRRKRCCLINEFRCTDKALCGCSFCNASEKDDAEHQRHRMTLCRRHLRCGQFTVSLHTFVRGASHKRLWRKNLPEGRNNGTGQRCYDLPGKPTERHFRVVAICVCWLIN